MLADPLDDTTFDNSNSIYHTTKIISAPTSESYRKNWQKIFGKKANLDIDLARGGAPWRIKVVFT